MKVKRENPDIVKKDIIRQMAWELFLRWGDLNEDGWSPGWVYEQCYEVAEKFYSHGENSHGKWKKFSDVKPPEYDSVLFRGFEDTGFKVLSVRSGYYTDGRVLLHEEGYRMIKLADDFYDNLEWTEIPR